MLKQIQSGRRHANSGGALHGNIGIYEEKCPRDDTLHDEDRGKQHVYFLVGRLDGPA